MSSITRRRFGLAATAGALGLGLAACADDSGTDDAASGGASDAGGASSVEVEDNNGAHTIALPPKSVVATDNRTFETLSDWDVKLSAAAVALMPSTIAYKDDTSIVDLGNHREPNLEAVVAAEPDLIVNGQRFSQFHDQFAQLAPDATILELDPRDDQPFDAELKRQVSVLGQVFQKETEAAALGTALDDAVTRAKAAYKAEDTVMAVIVSGGEIGYVAPTVGRTMGPLFDVLGLTPALKVEGADDDHQGDDISVEAIAQSNPAWILVMDRDAAVSADDPSYKPADEVISGSAALQGVTAVQQGHVLYMPADTYTNEGIQTYTEYIGSLADAFEAQK
ncbi:siderophore ABC transporter substrate-binding protein [Brachybacterium sp. AOP25-B2-12]|uniref:siderophore ABC transporter substrate-binding protein n=1 Tax=Brachybacterium sp. AOP25-B2-12 TaxID=3457710 RepID=UPI004034B07E